MDILEIYVWIGNPAEFKIFEYNREQDKGKVAKGPLVINAHLHPG